jgi:anti-sigma factor RsiW
MKCKDIIRSLSAYSDGELDRDARSRIAAHLEKCSDCTHALERLSKIWEILDWLPEAEPNPHFYIRLKARKTSEKQERKESWIENVLIPVCSVAVVILGIMVGNLVGKNGDSVNLESSVEEEMVSTLHLDSFNDFPSASVGDAYYNLTYAE